MTVDTPTCYKHQEGGTTYETASSAINPRVSVRGSETGNRTRPITAGSSKEASIPKGTLANWVAASKAVILASEPGSLSPSELSKENARLRKELAEARMERDILKKATAYFARESLQGTRS